MVQERCPNDNHGRAVVTVRCCPNCGKVLNEKIPAGRCSPERHASRRREQHSYCVDCGDRLLQEG